MSSIRPSAAWSESESGEIRVIVAVTDIRIWRPRYGRCEWFHWIGGDYRLRADLIGYFYAPLILFDQRYIHPTTRLIPLPP